MSCVPGWLEWGSRGRWFERGRFAQGQPLSSGALETAGRSPLPSRSGFARGWRASRRDSRPSRCPTRRRGCCGATSRRPVRRGSRRPRRETRERSSFLAYRDEAGRVFDFHATRSAYVTRLIRGGVNVKQAQVLARHSTAELTVGVYADTDAAELGAAVARLRPLPGGAGSALCAESAPETALALPAPSPSGPNGRQADLDKIGAETVESGENVALCRDVASTDFTGARSSVGQSIGFLIRRSQVRILPGVPRARRRRCRGSRPDCLHSQPTGPLSPGTPALAER